MTNFKRILLYLVVSFLLRYRTIDFSYAIFNGMYFNPIRRLLNMLNFSVSKTYVLNVAQFAAPILNMYNVYTMAFWFTKTSF